MTTKNSNPNLGSKEQEPELLDSTSLFIGDIDRHIEITERENALHEKCIAEGKTSIRDIICNWKM